MNRLKVIFWKSSAGMPLTPVFQGSFEARTIFDRFLNSIMTTRMQEGRVQPNDEFVAALTLHYREAHDFDLHVTQDVSAWVERGVGFSIEQDEPVRNTESYRSLTLAVRTFTHPQILTQDFAVTSALLPFYRTVEQVVVERHLLSAHDTYIPLLYAGDDVLDARVTAIETQKQDLSGLVEILPDDDDTLQVAGERTLAAYPQRTAVGTVNEGGSVQIVCARRAFEEMQAIARGGARVEQGGVLVGVAYLNRDIPGGYIVDISDQLFAESAQGTHVQLRYTFEDWQRQIQALERFPDKRVVGWYHTHLLKLPRVDAAGQTIYTELFFSADDIFIQRQFFKDPWHVALVLNPQGEPLFFGWHGSSVVEMTGFYLV